MHFIQNSILYGPKNITLEVLQQKIDIFRIVGSNDLFKSNHIFVADLGQ